MSPTYPFQKRNDVLYLPQSKPLDPENLLAPYLYSLHLSTHVSFLHNLYQFLPRTPQRRILLPVTSLASCPREFLRPALLLGPEFLVVRLCVHLQLAEIRADDFFAAIRALFAISHILNPHPVSPSLIMHHAPQRGKQLPSLLSLFFLNFFASLSPLNNGHGNVQFISGEEGQIMFKPRNSQGRTIEVAFGALTGKPFALTGARVPAASALRCSRCTCV